MSDSKVYKYSYKKKDGTVSTYEVKNKYKKVEVDKRKQNKGRPKGSKKKTRLDMTKEGSWDELMDFLKKNKDKLTYVEVKTR